MPLPLRLIPGDEELGKRDDDHKLGTKNPAGIAWKQRRLPHGLHRRTMKRAVMAILALIGLYYFFKNMPTDLENPRPRPHYQPQQTGKDTPIAGSRASPVSESSIPSREHEEATERSHSFNGPIKFYELASSLHAVSKTKGSETINHNVVSLGRLL
jgi:hypothetical protein